MTVYLIADVKVTDDRWVPAYAASVHDIVHKHGGKYLARSGNVKTLEGKPLDTTLIALLQFPSAEGRCLVRACARPGCCGNITQARLVTQGNGSWEWQIRFTFRHRAMNPIKQ